jgi:hypothetical protein
MERIDLAEDRRRCQALENVVMNLRVPETAGNILTSREIVSFSTKTLLHVVRSFNFLCAAYLPTIFSSFSSSC